MLTTPSGRTQVWTSLVATGVLVAFWPLVRKHLGAAQRQPNGKPPEADS
jgi:GABA permease